VEALTIAMLVFVTSISIACKAISTPVVADASELALRRAGRLEYHFNVLYDRPRTIVLTSNAGDIVYAILSSMLNTALI